MFLIDVKMRATYFMKLKGQEKMIFFLKNLIFMEYKSDVEACFNLIILFFVLFVCFFFPMYFHKQSIL